jgi:putative DNA-invertase from lambdoid prophage Rac
MLQVVKPAVVYLRVSKKDGSQTTDNQRPEVEALAASRGLTIVASYEDHESGVKRRPGLEQMLTALRKGQHGVSPTLVIWSLDRLGRGLSGCFDVYRQFVHLGVRVTSVRESWLDVDGPTKELLVAVMSFVSGWERDRLVERTKAGLDRARKNGTPLGRPRTRLSAEDMRLVMELRAAGWGTRRIAPELGSKVAPSTLDKVLKELGPKMGPSRRLASG